MNRLPEHQKAPTTPVDTMEATSVQNLYRRKSSDKFYAIARVQGKQRRHGLGTSDFNTARVLLARWMEDVNHTRQAITDEAQPLITFGAAIRQVTERALADPDMRPMTKRYWEQNRERLLKSDPGLIDRQVATIRQTEWEKWADELRGSFSAWTYNKALQLAKRALNYAIRRGAVRVNPIVAAEITGRQAKLKEVILPSPDQFKWIVYHVRTSGGGYARKCGDLVELLTYTGLRIGEVKRLLWSDIEWDSDRLVVRESKTDAGRRFVPLVPAAQKLLKRMWEEQDRPKPGGRVSPIGECQKAMDRACKLAQCQRLTHHDLRRLFTTRCIECGADIPTIARWLGHKDGGALLMRVYGRIRDDHSRQVAQTIDFSGTTTTTEGTSGDEENVA
jgi:integrase